jgi:hypothetical protein
LDDFGLEGRDLALNRLVQLDELVFHRAKSPLFNKVFVNRVKKSELNKWIWLIITAFRVLIF